MLRHTNMREFTTTHVKSLDVKKALGRDVKNTFPLTTHALAYAHRAKVSPQCFGPRKTDFEKKTERKIKKNKKQLFCSLLRNINTGLGVGAKERYREGEEENLGCFSHFPVFSGRHVTRYMFYPPSL